MNINIDIKLFIAFLDADEEYRKVLLYIIDSIEHGKLNRYRNVKEINRKDVIAKCNISKEVVYEIMNKLTDIGILRKSFGNDTYIINENSIVENTFNTIRSFKKEKINKFIDTTAIYKHSKYNKCKILYLHYMTIVNETFPCVTFKVIEDDTIVTVPLVEFINDSHKTKATDTAIYCDGLDY